MKKLRVLVLVHEDLVPPDDVTGVPESELDVYRTEFDVVSTLRDFGHTVQPLGLFDELGKLRRALKDWRPHIAFNLLEEFHNVAAYDQHVASYLGLMREPYTGCNPAGLLLSRDKAISKKIMLYHRIATPRFTVFKCGGRRMSIKRLRFPLVVKSATEDASLTLAQASVVGDESKLRERVEFVHDQTGTDALVEDYIEGRELYVGVLGNQRLQTFPVWEMNFGDIPEDSSRLATRKVKWDEKYRKKYRISTGLAKDIDQATRNKIARICKRVYRALNMSGYARMDLRLTDDGKIFLLEANANPELSYGDDLAESAEKAGLSYEALLNRIVSLGLNYRVAWRKS